MSICVWWRTAFIYTNTFHLGCAVACAVGCWPVSQRSGFDLWLIYVGFVEDRLAQNFPLSTSVFVCHQFTMLHPCIAFIYHWHYIIFAIDSMLKKKGHFSVTVHWSMTNWITHVKVQDVVGFTYMKCCEEYGQSNMLIKAVKNKYFCN